MQKLIFLLSLSTSLAFAAIPHAPSSFTQNGRTHVFVDMKSADYQITYDVAQAKALVTSRITFETAETGHPLFDLLPAPTKVLVGPRAVLAPTVTLPDGGTMRRIDLKLAPGRYTLVLQHQIKDNIEFSKTTKEVRSGFWMGDMSDRRFLEQYLPTNLEYDQMKISITVKVLGTEREHVVKSNGDVVAKEDNSYAITYPGHYTCSSIFFHLHPKGAFEEHEASITSIAGHKIPFIAYSASKETLDAIINKAPTIMRELERDYGIWPHPQLLVYGAGSGGMEYVGATITSVSALGHEMHHSYFARGMIPARGNDGWLDEALARWRDGGYRQANLSDLTPTKMAGHSQYRRNSDRGGYTYGERFIAHLDQKFSAKGGMLPFLKAFAGNKMFQINTTKDFQAAVQTHFGQDLSDLFNRYIYGKSRLFILAPESEAENPYHPRLTPQQLRDLL